MIDFILDLLTGFGPKIWGWVVGAFAVAASLFLARRSGAKSANAKMEADAAKGAIKQREDIDNALENSRAGGGDWHDRLRQHRADRD